jgi:uncharacterized protein YggT (Ycf19 family)
MYSRENDPAFDDPIDDRQRGPGPYPPPGRSPEGRPPYVPRGPVEPYSYRAVQVAWFVFGVLVALIALRFSLKLLGASTQAEFVSFVYGISAPLVSPFRGIFPDTAQGYFVFEASSLVAMVIYLLLGWGVVALIKILTAPRHRSTL